MSVTDPRKEGLPPLGNTTGVPDGDGYFLIGGVRRMTSDLMGKRAISADAIRSAEALIQAVSALEQAMKARFAAQVTIIDEEDAA